MATAAVTHTMVTLTTALASEVNTNFSDLVAFLNGSALHKDGAVAMTGELTLSGAPTTDNSAARKLYVDSSVSGAVPPGIIAPYAGATAPTGYLLCYGQEVSEATYSALFAVVGTAFNTGGEAGGNFRTPDLRGRTTVGIDNMGGSDAGRHSLANTMGTAGGFSTPQTSSVGLSVSGSANTGTVSAFHTHSYVSGGTPFQTTTIESVNHTHSVSMTSTGTGTKPSTVANTNLQPSMVINYIIKT